MQESVERTDDKKVVIIGGGPAGLTAAYQLSKLDAQSVVLEKDQMIGGISRTVLQKLSI
jgi:protoporphyrinogen oxidase